MEYTRPRHFLTLVSILILAEVCYGTAIGYFEVQIVRVQNTAGELLKGNCCDGTRDEFGCSLDTCDTFFRVCLKEYQTSGKEANSESCTFGSGVSPVLGSNSFTIDGMENSDNPGRIKLPLHFTWTRTFTLIVEALDRDNITENDPAGSEEQMIERHVHTSMLTPSNQWHAVSHNGPTANIEYRIRVRCNAHHYGFNCTKFCKPRSGFFGHYTCDRNGKKKCLEGWMGEGCTKPICKLGCSTEHGSCEQPNECKCKYGWQGELCNECVPYPGCDHGTCTTPWGCTCDTNWGGLLCNKNLNYCGTHLPCRNGGTCTNPEPDRFQCSCLDGFSGVHCEIAEYACISNPCENGGVCQNEHGGYRCHCQAGWTGQNCQINIDDCESMPCANGGTCYDQTGGFYCECPPHWEGATCQLDADECKDSPCVHAKSCRNLPGNYYCVCEDGWRGKNCDKNINECVGQCKNGATCLDMINGFHCACAEGFEGTTCEVNSNDCAGDPCLHGGQCVDKINKYQCICPAGFSGKRCELEEGYCEPNPCENGAECFNMENDYYCKCSSKYEGKNCSILKNDCENALCEVIDSCTIHVSSNSSKLGYVIQESGVCGAHGRCVSLHDNQFECKCDPGYEGVHCELNVDDCVGSPCENGGTCIDEVNSYKCICAEGWEGKYCEINFNDCDPDPCHGRGRCIDKLDGFVCKCRGAWKGKTCSSKRERCEENTCANGGRCIPTGNSFKCSCAAEWSGSTCTKRKVPACLSSPCQNGGTCVGDGESYSCYCRDGFAGDNCEENIDDCSPYPCYNSGRCIDGINHYRCECKPGFAGPDCRTNVNECQSSPCSYGSTCVDQINGYLCKCPHGRTGKNCNEVVAPDRVCYFNGVHYDEGDRWTDVCNTCTCRGGRTQCSNIWCGSRICMSPRIAGTLPCPGRQTCQPLSQDECFTTDCKVKGMCRLHSHVYPEDGDLGLPEPSASCFPNAKKLPTSNCARVTLTFDRFKLPMGVWVSDICANVRQIPKLSMYALEHPLVVRCAKSDEDPEAIRVTVTSNGTKDEATAQEAAELVANFRYEPAEYPFLSSLTEVKVETTIIESRNGDANYLIPLLASLAAVIAAIIAFSLLVCWCMGQRHRKPRADYTSGSQRDDVEDYSGRVSGSKLDPESNQGKHQKIYGLDVPKLNNVDLQEQQRSNFALNVNQLPSGKGSPPLNNVLAKKVTTTDLVVSAATAEKMSVDFDEKNLARKDPRLEDDNESLRSGRDVAKRYLYASSSTPTSAGTSSHSSGQHRRSDRIEIIGGKPSRSGLPPGRAVHTRLIPSVSNSNIPHHSHTHSYQQSIGSESQYDDVIDEDEVFDTSSSIPGRSSYHESSRLLPACNCRRDPCNCGDSSCETRRLYSRSSVPDEYSDSDEVAMYMGQSNALPQRHSHGSRRHRCQRSPHRRHDDDGRRSYRQRYQRRIHSPPSNYHDSEAVHSESDLLEEIGSTSRIPSRHLPGTSMDDAALPPYESVVSTGEIRPHTTSPPCDCSRGRRSPSPSGDNPGRYHQSPPPSYSQHYNRPSQSWRGNRETVSRPESEPPRVTPSSRFPYSPQDYGESRNYDSSRGHPGRQISGAECSEDRATSSSPGDDSTTELLSAKKSPHEVTV
ncbi:protein jagged-1b-like [Clavelina lepadiformis]|uniref:Delta-like protein n=1 Tax=Clavelina lepadiformis TaxID=159417 RepID=A0ABP0GLJ9_CLALP